MLRCPHKLQSRGSHPSTLLQGTPQPFHTPPDDILGSAGRQRAPPAGCRGIVALDWGGPAFPTMTTPTSATLTTRPRRRPERARPPPSAGGRAWLEARTGSSFHVSERTGWRAGEGDTASEDEACLMRSYRTSRWEDGDPSLRLGQDAQPSPWCCPCALITMRPPPLCSGVPMYEGVQVLSRFSALLTPKMGYPRCSKEAWTPRAAAPQPAAAHSPILLTSLSQGPFHTLLTPGGN